MKPLHALKCLIPINIAGLGKRNGRVSAVIYDLARALVCTSLEVVYTHATLAGNNSLRIDIKAAQLGLAGLCDCVVGQDSQKCCVFTEVRKGNRNIGLAASEGSLKHRGLEEAFLSGCFQAQHDLTKSQKLHCSFPPYYFCKRCTAKPPNSCLRYTATIFSPLYFAVDSSSANPFFASSAAARGMELVFTAM